MADIFDGLLPATGAGEAARPHGGNIFDGLLAPAAPRFPGAPGLPDEMGGEMALPPSDGLVGRHLIQGGAAGVDFLASGLPAVTPPPGTGPLAGIVAGWAPPDGPALDALAPVAMPEDPYAGANPWLAYPGLVLRGAAETGLVGGLGLSGGLQQPSGEGDSLWNEYLQLDPKDRGAVSALRQKVERAQTLTVGNKQAFQSAISDRIEGAPPVWKRDLGVGPPVDAEAYERFQRRQGALRDLMPASREQEQSLLGQVMRGIGSTGMFAPFAMIPGGVWAAGALAGMGEAAQRAYEGGATDGQQRRATLLGAAPGALDAVAIESALRPVVRGPGAIGWVGAIVATALRTGLIEGTTEGIQQFAQNLISQTTYNPEQALAEGVPENVLVGLLAGSALGGVGGMFAPKVGDRYLPDTPTSVPRGTEIPDVDVGAPRLAPSPTPSATVPPDNVPAGAVPIETLYGVPASPVGGVEPPTIPTIAPSPAATVPPPVLRSVEPESVVASPAAPPARDIFADLTPAVPPDGVQPVAPISSLPVPPQTAVAVPPEAAGAPGGLFEPDPPLIAPQTADAVPAPSPAAPRTIFDDLAPTPSRLARGDADISLSTDGRRAGRLEPAADAPVGLVSVDPSTVLVDADRFQFKGGGDIEGVTDRLQGVQAWDPMRAGVAVIYEEADGSRYIVDGHQRLALAKRLQAEGQSPRINAMLLREADGVTPDAARVSAALKNIAEGTGSPIDAARVFRSVGLSDDMVRSLPPRSALVRDGQALAQLSDDALGMVINGVVPENYAAFVGRAGFSPTQQLAALQALARGQPANAAQAEMMVRDIRESGFLEGEQSSLFGEEAFAQTLIAERAKVLDAAMKRLRTDRATFRTLVERSDIIAEAGNQLAQDANAARLTEDEQASALLSALATRRGPLSDALSDAARRLAAGARVSAAASDFLRAVKQLAGMAQEGREQGDPGSGAGGEGAARLQRAPGLTAFTGRVAGLQQPLTEPQRAAALQTVQNLVRRIAGETGIDPKVADRLFEVSGQTSVGEVFGAYDPQSRQLLASLASPNLEGTIRHELIHALRAMGAITSQQWTVLEKAATEQGWVTDAIRRGYPQDQWVEEAVAQKFADYMGGKISRFPAVNRIFAALRNFLNRLRAAARSNPSWRSLFSDIERGRFANASADRAAGNMEVAPAMQSAEPPHVPSNFFGFDNSVAALRRAVRSWADRNLFNRRFVNSEQGMEIRVNRTGIEKVTSHGPMPDQLLAVAAIPEMIERARFIRRESDMRSPGRQLNYLHFSTAVQIGDRLYDVDLVARQGAGNVPVYYYDHKLTKMRERGSPEFREGVPVPEDQAAGLPSSARTDKVGSNGPGDKLQRKPPPLRTSPDGRTDLLDTIDGPREQLVIPGAERVSDRQLAERRMQERMRSRRQQAGDAGPLFGDEDTGQGTLFERAPPLYSALTRAVEGMQLVKGSAQQWAGVIRNLVQKGVKQAEIDWSGVMPWLAEQAGSVSRANVLAYLRSQAVDVLEVEKAGAETKFGDHVLPGGSNYRELLLTLSERDADGGEVGAEVRGDRGSDYRSSHWDEPNVIAHIRFDERAGTNGERVLFVEEIQSDWHQAGRKKGYTPRNADQLQARRREIEALGSAATEAQRQEWAEIMNRLRPDTRDYEGNTGYRGVPDAPFKTTWPETAFRRMVRWAAEHGFDRVAWTPGAMQVERYDLSKRVDSLLYKQNPDSTYRVSAQVRGQGILLGDAITPDRLEDHVGKEIAERIAGNAGAEVNLGANNEPRDVWRSLSGIDLKVGGEGMSGFYDKILPAYANKFGKPFGAKVEPLTLPPSRGVAAGVDVPFEVFNATTGEVVAIFPGEGDAAAEVDRLRNENPRETYDYDFQKESVPGADVHSLPITQAMANAALEEGFPLFQIADMEERQEARSASLGRGIRDGRPLDQLLALPFRALGGIDVKGRWKPGAKLFDWGASVLTEKKLSPTGPLRWLNPMLESARAGLVDRYGLDPSYIARDRARQVEEIKLSAKGLDFLNALKDRGVDAQEARALQAMLTGEQIPNEQWSQISQPIRDAIDDMGLTAVSLGLIDRAAYERNKGAYLHRSYMKHEADNAGGRLRQAWTEFRKQRRARIAGSAMKGRGLFVEVPADAVPDPVRRDGQKVRVLDRIQGDLLDGGRVAERRYALPETPAPDGWTDRGEWEVRGSKGDKITLWRDFTKPERTQMGEIIDARYTIAKTFHLLAHDISVGRFYADIAQNNDWTRTMEPAVGTWINAGDVSGRMSTATGHEWVRVPDSTIPGTGGKKTWGALAGNWVRSEIWRDLNQIDQMGRQSFMDTVMRQWKMNKTSRSPVTHMNNIMSNVWLMDMADVRLRDLVGGIRSYVKEDADYIEARDNGAFGTGFVSAELKRDVLDPLLDEILKENLVAGQAAPVTMLNAMGKIANGLFGVAQSADRGMRQMYGIEDDIFRMATYKRRRDLGDSSEMAASAAREQFVDYDIRAPWVNSLRRSIFPFLAYTYRAVPLVARALATKPWKLAKYAILMNALNSLGYLMEPGDEDRERRSLREEQRGWTWLMTPRMLRLGFSDDYGNPLFLDMRRWVPVGDVFDFSQGQSAIAMPGPLAQLGGVFGFAAELALNKQGFTGKEIVGRVDSGGEAAAKIAGHAWRWFAPNAIWIPGSWSADKWWSAAAGERDRLGRPYNVPLATLSAFGIKAQPQDVFLGNLYRQFDYERSKRDIDLTSSTAARDLQQGRLNRLSYLAQMRQAQEKRQALDRKFADLLRDRRFQAQQKALRSKERADRARIKARTNLDLVE